MSQRKGNPAGRQSCWAVRAGRLCGWAVGAGGWAGWLGDRGRGMFSVSRAALSGERRCLPANRSGAARLPPGQARMHAQPCPPTHNPLHTRTAPNATFAHAPLPCNADWFSASMLPCFSACAGCCRCSISMLHCWPAACLQPGTLWSEIAPVGDLPHPFDAALNRLFEVGATGSTGKAAGTPAAGP